MQTRNLNLLYFVIVLLITSGCGAAKIAKLLPPHQQKLTQAASGKMSEEAKIDALGETLVAVLEESMSFTRVRCSVKHVEDFGNQNTRTIEKLLKELKPWMDSKSTVEKLMFAGEIAQKPYAKELVNLVPKFEKKVKRKIRTFKFMGNVMKFLMPGNLLGL